MLILYYKPFCQYSNRVIGYALGEGISLDLRDIMSDENHASALVAHGGKRQVPYLFDEEKDTGMYESADILEYLKQNYVRESIRNA